jgi:hypothetical protein
MACKCASIEKCKHDIWILSSQVSEALTKARAKVSVVTPALQAAATSLEQAVTIDHLHDVEGLLAKLNKQVDTSCAELVKGCGSEVQRLTSTLRSMTSEDAAYHDEQRRRAAAGGS